MKKLAYSLLLTGTAAFLAFVGMNVVRKVTEEPGCGCCKDKPA
ncbi:MAG: hypothetical protein PHI94_06235 [Eubacteriaceae bacterium]|jgi:hypothetical protein|nr:hypothetical protein [Eubacteriaceae bacterium]MDD4507774.1 hypothetical protein [Eubacteriaceae bacterium]